MGPDQKENETRKTAIVSQIAELSRLLGMIASHDTIALREPMTQKTMMLSDWLGTARRSFLELSLLISREMDIELR